ncbi:MAG: hypothetical protein LBT89_09290 [Planctomycetaceae bacterium]|jgi:hypothetical protein|nr:hypothetical protein [Planctomycetaceae bacterium]
MKRSADNAAEIVLLFLVCVLYGAWMVPDVNEVYYVGKAIHFWQPNWIAGDEFLDGKDSHWTFYAVFGWLPLFFSPAATAWIGRCTAWVLLAWSWQRLSFTLVPVRYASVITGLALAYYISNFHEAGEWLFGGIEGKTVAYPLVFFALTEMLCQRWGRCFVFLAAASAFHILVGGWSLVIITGLYFIALQPNTPPSLPLHTFVLPCQAGLFVCGLLCGLMPALLLDYGTPAETVRQAHQIYCFERLHHHLVPYLFPFYFRCRFALLVLLWIFLCRFGRNGNRQQRLFDGFVWGTLVLAGIGYAAAYVLAGHRELSAEILRFYWFRMADIAVPMGIAVGALSAICAAQNKPALPLRKLVCLALLFLPMLQVLPMLESRCKQMYPRTEPVGIDGAVVTLSWYDLCRWIRANTPPDARFWIPRDGTTFKWYAQRSDVGVWKNIPQDAAGVVRWQKAMNDLYTYRDADGVLCTDRLLTTLLINKTPEELLRLKQEYGFQYVVCLNLPAVQPDKPPVIPQLPPLFESVYSNAAYSLFLVRE